MRKMCLLLLFFVPVLTVQAQIEEVKRITQTLCSPELHGRGYVNSGDSLAAEFIISEFKKLHLKPLKKTFTQSFQMNVNTFPGKIEVKLGEHSLTPGVDFLVDPASASADSEWKPFVIQTETALQPEKLKKTIAGIIEKKTHNAFLISYAGLSKDTLKKIAGLSEQLAQILPVIQIVDQKFIWSVAQEQLPNAYIQIQDSVYQKYKQDGLIWKVKIEAKYIRNYTSRNVVALLKSKNKNAKTLIFSAHYDHLGRMGQATYFPGGNDNASGTAMLLSMAKYFTEHPTDYNLIFIAFAGEEAGLVGSKYFTEHPMIKLEKINFLINLDIMGSGEEGITVVNATKFEDQFNRLVKINDDSHLLAQVKKRGPAANSDHYWFTEKGVPSFFIYTMGPNKNYHDVFDTYEALSFKEYEDIKTMLVKFVEGF